MNKLFIEKILMAIGVKKIFVFLLASSALIILSGAIVSDKEDKLSELKSTKQTTIFAKKLLKNKTKLEFVSEHLFNKKANNFNEYVKKGLLANHIKITRISPGPEIDSKMVKKCNVAIDGMCWHDSCIFKFLEYMKEYSPGFVKIIKVEISKIDEISTFSPAIKVGILCETFQKK